MSYIIELPYTPGATVYAYPSSEGSFTNWASRRVLASEAAGRYRATVTHESEAVQVRSDCYGKVQAMCSKRTAWNNQRPRIRKRSQTSERAVQNQSSNMRTMPYAVRRYKCKRIRIDASHLPDCRLSESQDG